MELISQCHPPVVGWWVMVRHDAVSPRSWEQILGAAFVFGLPPHSEERQAVPSIKKRCRRFLLALVMSVAELARLDQEGSAMRSLGRSNCLASRFNATQ